LEADTVVAVVETVVMSGGQSVTTSLPVRAGTATIIGTDLASHLRQLVAKGSTTTVRTSSADSAADPSTPGACPGRNNPK
jgi:hypothetical protein